VTSLSDTDTQRVIDLIKENPYLHEDAFAKQYGDSFPDDVRLETIDRTERHRANQYSYNEFAKKAGATYKQRVTAGDDRVRDTHTEDAEAGWVPIEEDYPASGEAFPGSDDINCRCSQMISFSDETPD
jgi:uncharacterized protein with gpF-like domain